MSTLILVRGLPGSGKTTLAIKLAAAYPGAACHAADDYFTNPLTGEYRFDSERLQEAHEECQDLARLHMRNANTLVVVHNTFSQRWEMERYFQMAEECGYQVHVVDLFNAGLSIDDLVQRNEHSVPYIAVKKMWERWQHDWRTNAERQVVKFRPGNYQPKGG